MWKSRLLVVGAGPVGLGMADALRQAGIPYDQVDAATGIGGNWRHGVYSTVHVVSSKRSTAYADYPMPADYPDFPSGAQMLAYLESYARDRGLMDAIELGREVVEARPNPDDTWRVRFAGGETRTYKGVAVCNGHHWDRIMPDLPGTFTGRILHAKDYRQPSDLAGQRVLVIGAGNSGCDLASEAARIARSSDWSLRSGVWFLPKTALGRPLTDLPIWGMPLWMQRLVLRGLIRVLIGDYRSYGLPRPNHRIFERHPTFGTEALGYIRQGRIRPRPAIAHCEGNTVRFVDGSSGTYDLIVAATGYRVSLPFLPEGLVTVRNNVAEIYGGAFPAGVKNLYIIGSEQPRNGFGALLTPAACLYARLIKMQDELEHPIGSILEFGGEKIPPNPFIDPAQARRRLWWGHRLLPVFRLEARLLARRRPYRPIALDLAPPSEYREAAE
jgi:hypothetical protein